MIRLFILTGLLIFPTLLFAAELKLFQSIPFLSDAGNQSTESYINALYQLSISLAAILAVLKLMWAGTQYMLSEIVTKKEKAREDIKGALLGLLIILAAVTLLNTINPNLTKLDFLSGAPTAPPIFGQAGETQSITINRVRENSQNVISEFTGEISSPEHLAWIRECVEGGGLATRSLEDSNTIECRAR